jgi:hypothetical protein
MKAKTIIAGFTVALLSACSSLSVQTQKDPLANLSHYHTYAWAPETTPTGQHRPSSILDQTVKSSVERDLAAKGLTKAVTQPPDLLLAYSAGNRYVSSYGYDRAGMPYNSYSEGTLRLDFIDSKTNRVVWEGTASDAVSSTGANAAQVTAAVDKMLEKYPA